MDPSISFKYGELIITVPKFSLESIDQLPEVRWRCGSCSLRGPRNSNEDRFIAINDICSMYNKGPDYKGVKYQGFYAIYDGHCGSHASDYLQEVLHTAIFNHPSYESDLSTAILETCLESDRKFLDICKNTNSTSGTTALGVFIRGSVLTVFNIGDCQAVLCRAGKVPHNLNVPHKPGRPDEFARVIEVLHIFFFRFSFFFFLFSFF